jgi:hypothetical protein
MSMYLEAAPVIHHPPVGADQLDTLLGEQLMPLRIRSNGADEPYLLAVDASGQPVVVEVVGLLDADAVLRALRYAGRASSMSTRDLAEAYRGGADRFASHLAAYRLTVPASALLSTFVRGGARLLLVCTHMDPDIGDVVDFLLQPGWQVDVLQVRVQEIDGQRVMDVSPVLKAPEPRRTTEPWSAHHSDRPAGAYPNGNNHPRNGVSNGAPIRSPGPATVARPPAVVQRPAFAAPAGGAREPWAAPRPDLRLASPPERREPRVVNRPAPRPFVPRPDPRLAVVADDIGAPVALVWLRERHGECYEALLRPDGTLELPDGSRFADPDAAAQAACGSQRPVDGWRSWHIGSLRGPALADLVAGLR